MIRSGSFETFQAEAAVQLASASPGFEPQHGVDTRPLGGGSGRMRSSWSPLARVEQPRLCEAVSKKNCFQKLQLQSSPGYAVTWVAKGSPLKWDELRRLGAQGAAHLIGYAGCAIRRDCLSCVCALGCHRSHIPYSESWYKKLYKSLLNNIYS